MLKTGSENQETGSPEFPAAKIPPFIHLSILNKHHTFTHKSFLKTSIAYRVRAIVNLAKSAMQSDRVLRLDHGFLFHNLKLRCLSQVSPSSKWSATFSKMTGRGSLTVRRSSA